MVVGIKDNLCYKNHKVSASSKILDGFESLFTATSVQRLIDEDAIIIGRLNCDEFAMGSANENTIYGTVKNPLHNLKVAGGSSGGSAAAVAAGLCLAALGSDTGGSIRQPAAFCGIVGLKPTYARVSRYGLIAYASSFDQIGPLTNNVSDAALILEVIAGKDDFDSTVSKKYVDNYSTAKFDNKPKKIAYISECLNRKGLDSEVKEFIEKKLDKLKSEGHIVEPISFPYLDLLIPTYYVITTAEASSNLARFDGVHYGYRSENITDLETTYINSRTEGFGEEVKRRIMLGTFVLSAGYHDAYFTKAQKIRRLIKDKTNETFEEYDFVVSPTTPHTPFEIGKKQTDPTVMYLEDIFTVQANLAGNPAISLPLGKHSNGLPIGLHLMADNFKEADLFAFSKYLSN
jgi:aspartyl-tRNA(Asn)/glutamyl-tRNA(Gln) amidotransferase subunit A